MERTHDKVWMSWITFGSTSCTRGGVGRTKVNRLHPKLHPNAAPIIFHRNFRVFSHIGYSFLRCIDALNIRFFTFWMKLKKKQFQIFYKWFSSLTLPLSSNPKKELIKYEKSVCARYHMNPTMSMDDIHEMYLRAKVWNRIYVKNVCLRYQMYPAPSINDIQ